MIYTITTNPAIDYILRFDKFEDGATIRASEDEKYPGGKGIMASKILYNLGEKSVNLGFVGGFIGEYIANSIRDLGLDENFVRIKENSRINVKLKYDKETEINAKGPMISKEEVQKFFDSLEEIEKGDVIVISGSLPYSLDSDFYKKVIEKTEADFTIDIADKKLLDYLAYKPLLVKPNEEELGKIFETEINDDNLVQYARKLNELGAKNVIVSLGGKGSIFVDENKAYRAKPIHGKLVNSVGAGDSMVGGFVYGMVNKLEKIDAYKLAVACGTATAFSPDIADRDMINQILSEVEVEEIGN
ncbi:1-phosphofructokinase [Anaerococcus degeneri]|uniref:Tagatose-6-phosphate kinase n=1 Tax=Anaerococcus degeneri TaxID=361500 RepID=A0ABS7Z2N6_9FIRM|nr:1-phosphofructokinase [Anaerococcus degeneri]MBP2014583.1 1-phosphofructokinase [Anaerococcus degeneri]MCA2096796.1 1-phosphofructokinase [Anaerococcus degeneri]